MIGNTVTEITKDDIGAVLSGILKSADKELLETSNDELEKYFYFQYDENRSKEWNLYKFSDALEMYKERCRRWEEFHNGYSCVVERVRDKYLMPKIKDFLAKVSE